MISERALEIALDRSLITADQATGLRAVEAGLAPAGRAGAAAEAPADDENLRFVSGFADVFVTIGIVLFLGALAFIMGARTGSSPMYAGLAACAWLLAEFFSFKRRMALPSIVLLVVFVAAVFVLAAQIAAALLPAAAHVSSVGDVLGVPLDLVPLAAAGLVAAGMAAVHYLRFRVPITVAAGTAALCVLVVASTVGAFPAVTDAALDVALFACGLAVFALAMRFDMSDHERLTRRTDIAFWLHLLAAPLIVHPLIRGLLHGLDDRLTPGAAVGILWVFLVLGFVAVVVDRRALLVSGLLYAGVAFGTLVRSLGVAGTGLVLPIVLLALGAFILLLSAGWHLLRRAILRRLPRPLARRLPHPLLASPT